jgi:hypothetical protein
MPEGPPCRDPGRVGEDLGPDRRRRLGDRGGLYDGATLEIEAVRTGEGWRIDQFLADIPVGP